MIRHRLFASALTSALALAACGDNNPGTDVDAGPDVDAGAEPDAPDAPDAPAPFVAPTPVSLALSAAGPDQLMAAIPGPAGSFYAAGYVAADLAGARAVVVVKLTSAGALDTTFGGGDGIATTGLVFRGGSGEIELATQAAGAIVVAATVAHAGVANPDDAADTDIALTRLDATGAVDATFGTLGVATLDLNDSILDTTPDPDVVRGRDGVRGIAIGPSDQIFVHAVQRAEGNIVPQSGAPAPRIDTEFAVLRLTAGGVLDVTYGTGASGKHLLDIYAQATHSNATPHGLLVNTDGTVIANGYASSAATGNTVQPVLYKVNAAGTALVTAFADGGLFYEEVLAAQTEIYGVALHGTTLITGGYGRANTAATNDYISMKFDATTGVRDLTFGGAALGAVTVDPSGMTLADNCRGALALPSGSTVLFGSVGAAGARDAAMAVLTSGGALDTAFGDGTHTFDFATGTEDQLWGGAVSGGKVLLVGWRGVGMAATATSNDDATVLLFDAP